MGWLDWFSRADAAPMQIEARQDAPAVTAPFNRADATHNLVTALGGASDKAQAIAPAHRPMMDDDTCWVAYRHNGLIRRAINIRVGDCTRRGWRIEAGEEPEDPLAQRWQDLGVAPAIRKALRWSFVFRGAAIWMRAADEEGGASASSPLTDGTAITGLTVVDGMGLKPGLVSASRNDGKPETWWLTINGQISRQVHHSRLLIIPGMDVPGNRAAEFDYLGQSWLDAIFEAVGQYDQIANAGAVLATELKQTLVKIKGLAALDSADQAQLIELRLRLLAQSMGVLGIMVMDEDDDYTTQASPPTGFRELSDAAQVRCAAWLEMPQAKLFGSAPGGLSTDDAAQMSNWRDVVADLQETRLRPVLERLAEVCFAEPGMPTPDRWRLEFEALDEPTEAEQADIELKHAQADEIRVRSGVLDPDHIARSRFGARGYSAHILPLSDEDLEAMSGRLELSDEDLGLLRGEPDGDPQAG